MIGAGATRIDPMWTNDPTMTLVTFISGSDSTIARAVQAFCQNKDDPEPALRRWVEKEIEIADDSPTLSKLLLKTSFYNIQWDVVISYIRIKAELAIIHN